MRPLALAALVVVVALILACGGPPGAGPTNGPSTPAPVAKVEPPEPPATYSPVSVWRSSLRLRGETIRVQGHARVTFFQDGQIVLVFKDSDLTVLAAGGKWDQSSPLRAEHHERTVNLLVEGVVGETDARGRAYMGEVKVLRVMP